MKRKYSLHKNWDVIYTKPGTEIIHCPTCAEEMVVERNVECASSWAESMSGKKGFHDRFTCRNSDENWHRQARILKQKIQSTPSNALTKLMEEEIKEILETKKCTKELSSFDYL